MSQAISEHAANPRHQIRPFRLSSIMLVFQQNWFAAAIDQPPKFNFPVIASVHLAYMPQKICAKHAFVYSTCRSLDLCLLTSLADRRAWLRLPVELSLSIRSLSRLSSETLSSTNRPSFPSRHL